MFQSRRLGSAGLKIRPHRRIGNERVRVAAEEIRISVCDAGDFLACHGMTTEKERAIREKFSGGLRDAQLGAARVRDECVAGGEACNVWKKIKRGSDGKRDVDEVSSTQGRGEVAMMRVVNDLARASFAESVGAIPAGDTN